MLLSMLLSGGRRSLHRALPLGAALLVALPAPSLQAQSGRSDSLPATPTAPDSTRPAQSRTTRDDSAGAPAPVITGRAMRRTALVTLVATGVAVPFDRTIARDLQRARGGGRGPAESAADVLNWLGDPGTVVAPLALVVIGRAGHSGTLVDVGVHAAEALVVSSGVTGLLKGTAGRRRPTSGPPDPDDFTFGAGFKGEASTSFPSGHATAAFTLATVLTAETMRVRPGATWLVGSTSFALATGVGLARLYTNHHWASDVALGAGIGTLSALAVERFAHGTGRTRGVPAWVLPHKISVAGPRSSFVAWTAPLPM